MALDLGGNKSERREVSEEPFCFYTYDSFKCGAWILDSYPTTYKIVIKGATEGCRSGAFRAFKRVVRV